MFIRDSLNSDYLEHRLEAVIILGEIKSTSSAELLYEVLSDSSQHEEIRSGSAWALGELQLGSSIPILIQAFNELEVGIRIEAARALNQ